MNDATEFGIIAAFAAFALSGLAAWITHMIWAISTLASDFGATAGQIAFGAIGTFVPPVGAIHGFMIWFGAGI